MRRGPGLAILVSGLLAATLFGVSIVAAQQVYLLIRVTTIITDTGFGFPGLVEIEEVQVSPDGRHLYAGNPNASPASAAITVFTFEPDTGFPTFVRSYEDNGFSIDGIDGPKDFVFSADGLDFYIMASGDNQVSHWSRNPATGFLTFEDAAEEGQLGVTEMLGPVAGAMSPDGRHLYVAVQGSNALTTLNLDIATGTPTFGSSITNAAPSSPPITNPTDVLVSPNGAHVYVSSFDDNAIAIFERDNTTGAVTYLGAVAQNSGGITTLVGVADLTMDSDGRHIYATARSSAAVNIFSRDANTGLLTFIGFKQDEVDGVDGLLGATSITLGPKGLILYVAGEDEDEIAVFGRIPATGQIVFLQAVSFVSMTGLDDPSSISVVPTGDRVMVSSRATDAVHTFAAITVTSFRGQIVDSISSDPVTCGTIELRSNNNVFTAVTDAQGFYFFPLIPPDLYSIRIFATGFGETVFSNETIDIAATRIRNFVVDRSGAPPDIAGLVTDADTNLPLVAVRVQLLFGASVVAQTYTCASGAFELNAPGQKGTDSTTLRFELENYDTEVRNIDLVPDTTVQVEQPLMKSVTFPGSLSGFVLESTKGSGTPLPNAQVTIRGPVNATTQTDGSGGYSFDVLDGTYSIRASKTGFVGATIDRAVAGGSSQVASLTLTPEANGDPADVSGDGIVNSVDIQLVINGVLGIPVTVDTDVNTDGSTNSVDIQLVINAVLGTK